jgi:DNA-directed RNA polymerase subunit M/transcription elongation factor TFIIS
MKGKIIMTNKPEPCDNCGGTLIKKTSGHEVYFECQYCGEKEERDA